MGPTKGVIVAALIGAAIGCRQAEEHPNADAQRLAVAEFAGVDTPTIPSDESYAPTSLPHLWSETQPAYEGSGWYRLRFTPATVDAAYAVYLPKLNMNAAVYLNRAWIGDGGRFDPPVAQHWNRPLYFRVPATLLRPGENVLHVRLFAYAHDWGGLFPVWVGPHTQLVDAYERQYTLQIVVSQLASVMVLVLALTMGALAIGSRDSVYGYWALGCTLYFVHSLSAHVRDIGLPYPVGRWLIHASFDLFAVSLAIGMHRWAEVQRPSLERAMVTAMLGGAAITLAVPGPFFLPLANALHLLALVVGVYAATIMVRHFGRLGGPEVRITIGAGVVTLGFGVHALLIYFGVLPQDEPRLLKLMAPLLMLGFGGVLIARYVRSARTAALLNVELEARVEAKEAELRASYLRAQEAERAQLLETERA
ncbi:MAG: hypothetical protein AAFV29_20145, partial [Myxococcota bacterium]